MKKLLCLAAVSVMGFAAFADGPLSLTVDTKATWDSENGLDVTGGDDDFTLEIAGNYDVEKGGAMFRLRTNDQGSVWDTGVDGAIKLDRYEAWIKPVEGLKFSIGSDPVEVYNEEVKWDVPFGAGLFENGKHIYGEYTGIDGLTLAAGIGSAGLGSKDIQYGLTAWATYDIACTGSVSVEFESRSKETKVIGAQFNYNGIDNMNILAGYSTVLNDQEDHAYLAQHRATVDFRMSNDNMGFEVFNEAILRNKDYGEFGDRFAAKFSYFLNDTITPWLRAQYFMNYWNNDNEFKNGVAWSALQLTDFSKDDWLLIVEPRCTIDLGKGVSTVLGATVNYASYDLAADKKLTWSIPVEFIVAF